MTTSRKRTLAGIILFLPLAAILLLTFACLPAPVGDPDHSKVDPQLTGAWQTQDDKNTSIALLRPWDTHTYFLEYLVTEKAAKPGDPDKPGIMHFKAWITTIGNATFLTSEPLDNLDYAFGPDNDKKPFWFVARIEFTHKPDALSFRPINGDSALLKGLDTREKLEAAIKANIDNKDLYNDTLTFKKIPKENAKLVEDAMKNLHIGDGN